MKFLYYTYYRINVVALKISDDALNRFKAPFLIVSLECLLYYALLCLMAIVMNSEWIVYNKLFYVIPSIVIVTFHSIYFDFNKNLKNELKDCSYYPKEKKRKWDICIVLVMLFIVVSFFLSAYELHQVYPPVLKK